MVLHLGASARCDMGEELAALSGEHWSVAGVFREDVRACEKHGLSDQGATLWHELLFATRR